MAVPVLSLNLTTDTLTKRGVNKARRATNEAAGDYVLEKVVPSKFTRSAYYEGTQRRSRKYAERKLRKVGHDIPLVYTGRMKRHVRRNARATATANGGRVYLKNYFPMTREMRGELERLSARQVERLAKFMERDFAEQVGKSENKRTRRRRGS